MKTIVCGPPHSGKSIFISNLVRLMPSESFQRITANGDGEGTWSNNPNQNDVIAVRIKGSNTAEDFAQWRKQIQTAKQDIVLVDIGGRLQDDKGPLFDACDSFIVVSNSEDMINEWIAFGESHNCKCIATVLSMLGNANDTILSTTPYLQTTLSGLERGHDLQGSKVLGAVAEALVMKSGYKGFFVHNNPNDVDLFLIGKKLGCSRSWYTHNKIEVSTVWYTPDKAKALNDYLTDSFQKGHPYKIYGAKALWVACIVAKSLGGENTGNIMFYDEWTDSFIAPRRLEKSNTYDSNKISISETEDSIKLSAIQSGAIDTKSFETYIIPEIDRDKPIYISGRFPNWFVASLMLSYDNPDIFLHIPGQGYIKVVSKEKELLGEMLT